MLKDGETVTNEHLRALDAAIARGENLRGRGLRTRYWPWGQSTVASRGAGVEVSSIFSPETEVADGGVAVRWQLGYIAGRIPTVEGLPIADIDDSYERPPFLVPPESFNEFGKSFVYFRVTLADVTFEIESIEPFASPEEVSDNRLHGHRLACVVSADGDLWRAIYTNQTYTPAKGRGSGAITHFFASDF